MSSQDLWGGGEYQLVADRLMPFAERLVDAVGPVSGREVLDVGAGTGNAALVAAARGARVTCVEPSAGMIAMGRLRTADANLPWFQAGAELLPFADASFDAVLSVMAAVFAEDADATAGELLRVVKPGGAIGLTAWTLDGFLVQTMGYIRELRGDAPPATAWHDETFIRERFGAVAAIDVERVETSWGFLDADALVDFFERGAPPSVAARRALGPGRWQGVRDHIREQVSGTGPVTVDASYLQILVRREGGPAGHEPGL